MAPLFAMVSGMLHRLYTEVALVAIDRPLKSGP